MLVANLRWLTYLFQTANIDEAIGKASNANGTMKCFEGIVLVGFLKFKLFIKVSYHFESLSMSMNWFMKRFMNPVLILWKS